MFRNAQLCTYILKNIQEEDPLFHLYLLCALKMNDLIMSPGECFGIIIAPPPQFRVKKEAKKKRGPPLYIPNTYNRN